MLDAEKTCPLTNVVSVSSLMNYINNLLAFNANIDLNLHANFFVIINFLSEIQHF